MTMTPTEQEAFRNVAAENMALSYLVELLLVQWLKTFDEPYRSKMVETLVRNGKRTEQLEGSARDNDELAEMFSDVTVRMHGSLEGIVARALARIATNSISKPEPPEAGN